MQGMKWNKLKTTCQKWLKLNHIQSNNCKSTNATYYIYLDYSKIKYILVFSFILTQTLQE